MTSMRTVEIGMSAGDRDTRTELDRWILGVCPARLAELASARPIKNLTQKNKWRLTSSLHM